ncbi:MAG: 50S ribosomal protein L9 [Treponema sp.]|jgi:large subunit ribosomal protein L9|nr:50S ribosomal protein L9 [Treponema sp.]
MKVILNKDLSPLGEEGDVKEVAKGYARNYLFPRDIAVPYNERTAKLFEARREAIEARKAQKRLDASSLKDRIEALNVLVSMPAGANGKLYGAVTAQTIADELGKRGFSIERKRIELPGNSFKNVGKYKVTVKLYENSVAELPILVTAQELKVESRPSPAVRSARHSPAAPPQDAAQTPPASVPAEPAAEATPAAEAAPAEPAAEASPAAEPYQ